MTSWRPQYVQLGLFSSAVSLAKWFRAYGKDDTTDRSDWSRSVSMLQLSIQESHAFCRRGNWRRSPSNCALQDGLDTEACLANQIYDADGLLPFSDNLVLLRNMPDCWVARSSPAENSN
jgi:hypothetical protein